MSSRRGSARIERLPSARGPELHPSLEPADDVAGGDSLGDEREERVVVEPLGLDLCGRQRCLEFLVVVGRPGVGVAHHVPAGRAEDLVPDVEGSADRRPRVAGSRLHVELFERCLRPDAPVRDRVQRDATRQAEVGRAGRCRQRAARGGG